MGKTETMGSDNDISVNGIQGGKNGRPSSLAQYHEFWCPEANIEPLLFAPMNRADWFALYGGYLIRAFRTGERTDRFNVPAPMRQYIENRLAELTAIAKMDVVPRPMQADKQLSRLLDNSDNPKLTVLSPSFRLSKAGWERACRLGSALMAVARRRPYLVRSVVLGYCYAATTRRYVVMTDAEDAAFGELLIELVEELHLKGLKIHLVGFRLGCNLPDIGHWLRVLGLPPPPVDFETANNVKSPARLKHVGIKICWGGSSRASQEWHEVALLAAIISLWSCVTPSHGFELVP